MLLQLSAKQSQINCQSKRIPRFSVRKMPYFDVLLQFATDLHICNKNEHYKKMPAAASNCTSTIYGSLSIFNSLALWLSSSLSGSLFLPLFLSLAPAGLLVQLLVAYMIMGEQNLPEVNSFLVVANSRPHYPVAVFAPAYMTDESESGQTVLKK